jgi:GalNAc-alpha-(1->4)-GalNAc-alpha-(1->3)-diNAcBac-PP-undecaprenol alpha-1,4-N-acetyl-D-galactosaminyltransferase
MKHEVRSNTISELFCSDMEPFQAAGGCLPAAQKHSSLRPLQKPASGHPQITQRKQRHELLSVLGQAFVANLGETELTLDHSEGVLHLGTHTGLHLLGFVQQAAPGRILVQRPALAGAHGHMPIHTCGLRAFGRSLVTGISKHHLLLSMQQAMALRDIVDVGSRTNDGMHQARISVHADVGFHAEVPLVAFLALVHFRVSLTSAVLGRTGCGNQGCINHRARLEHQAFGGQGGVDSGHDLQAQVVRFEQVSKPQDSALVGQPHSARIQSGELAVERDIVQGLFHGRVRQAKPLLREVDAQHRLHCKGGASTFGARANRCVRLDQSHQLRPRHHQAQFIEKHTFAHALRHKLEYSGGKVDLFHVRSTSFMQSPMSGFCRNSLARLRALRRFIATERPDVIVSFLSNVNLATIIASVGLGISVVVCERIDPFALPTSNLLRIACRFTYPLADALMVQTHAAATKYASTSWPLRRVRVIPNPVPGQILNIQSHISMGEKKRLLSVGRLAEQKQFGMLIKVFAGLARRHINWSLRIAGEGPLRSALQRQTVALGLEGRVELPGRIKNIGEELAGADAFVLTSEYEGFPNALLEAMAVGLPCVAFDCPSGPREMIMDGQVALLVTLNDEQELGHTLERLILDADLRQALGSSARASVVERFALDRVLRQWDLLFKEVGVKC